MGRTRAASAGRVPWAVRITAAAGLLLTLAYVGLYAIVRSSDSATAANMLRMYGLTIVAGRETAMLDALARGMPAGLVYGLSVLDDFGSFLLALPFAWLVVRVVKRSSAVRWGLAHFEKQALLRRRWVHRWGLGGLAMVYFLPGFGAGVPITVLLAVLARFPFARLVPFFAAATFLVDGLWAVLLTNAVDVLPETGWVEAIPLLVVAAVVLSAAVGAWRHRAERHVAVLDWPLVTLPDERERLLAWGITVRDGLVRADLDALASRLDRRERRKGKLIGIAELLMLGMDAAPALALTKAGVSGLEDVASSEAKDLAGRLGTEGSAAADWVARARRLVEGQHRAWTLGP